MIAAVRLSVSLFVAAILQCLCNNGAIPLYYELAIESTYPVAEVCTSMMMNVMYNALPLIFLAINYFTSGKPTRCVCHVNSLSTKSVFYSMTLSVCLSVLLVAVLGF